MEGVAGAGGWAEVEGIVEVGGRVAVHPGRCARLLSRDGQGAGANRLSHACLTACPEACLLRSKPGFTERAKPLDPRLQGSRRYRGPAATARAVQGFMGGSVPAKQVVQRYWQSAGAGGGSSRVQLAAPAGAQAYQKQEGVARVAQAPQQAPSRGGGGQGSRGGGSSSSRGGAPKGVELPPPTSPVAAKDGSKVWQQGV